MSTIPDLQAHLRAAQTRRWVVELAANARPVPGQGWITPQTPEFDALCTEECRLRKALTAAILLADLEYGS